MKITKLMNKLEGLYLDSYINITANFSSYGKDCEYYCKDGVAKHWTLYIEDVVNKEFNDFDELKKFIDTIRIEHISEEQLTKE